MINEKNVLMAHFILMECSYFGVSRFLFIFFARNVIFL